MTFNRWRFILILVSMIVGIFCAYLFRTNLCFEMVNVIGDPARHIAMCRRFTAGLVGTPAFVAILLIGPAIYRFILKKAANST